MLGYMLHRLQAWVDHRLRIGVYGLRGNELLACRGRRNPERLAVEAIRKWQIAGEMGFDIVVIELADGRVVNWIDRYDDLIGILRQVAADRELASRFA